MTNYIDHGTTKPLMAHHGTDVRGVTTAQLDASGPQVEAYGDVARPSSAGKCRLLLLPPELRNVIFRYVLVEDGNITIAAYGPLPAQPGLLSTCSQLRKENSSVYYQTLYFVFIVEDHNASTFMKWHLSSEQRRNCNYGYSIQPGQTNWPNLRPWLKAFHEGQCDGVGFPNARPDQSVVSRIFAVVIQCRFLYLTWAQAERVLEEMRKALGAQDEGWLREATDKEATDQAATDQETADQETADQQGTGQEGTDREGISQEGTGQEATA